MSYRMPFLPRLESLETKTVMSTGTLTSPAAVPRLEPRPVTPSLPSHEDAALRASTNVRKVDLIGQANGFFTSRDGPPDTGTRFRLNANGTIAPIGAAFVTGSFHTLGFTNGGVATGTLTIAGKEGKFHLELREKSPASGVRSPERADATNPRGSTTTGTTGTNEATSEPAILVNTFRFEITSGTGQYVHDRGTCTVRIETRPSLLTSTGPGTYSSSLASTAETGRTILTFTRA
jgi:hypothetical protein